MGYIMVATMEVGSQMHILTYRVETLLFTLSVMVDSRKLWGSCCSRELVAPLKMR